MVNRRDRVLHLLYTISNEYTYARDISEEFLSCKNPIPFQYIRNIFNLSRKYYLVVYIDEIM